jgi:hypothetical protein
MGPPCALSWLLPQASPYFGNALHPQACQGNASGGGGWMDSLHRGSVYTLVRLTYLTTKFHLKRVLNK